MIPVVLFAYARPDHLRRVVECLRVNGVPRIYAFSDGPCLPKLATAVTEVRRVLRAIDWCDVVLHERDENWGLGRSILSGVTSVLRLHESVLVFEDDLICVPGAYRYLVAALHRYRNDPRVMSVTGWTHPRVLPPDVSILPYFDGKAECWTWGTWRRAWNGMDSEALNLMDRCRARGIDIERYGTDLPKMAAEERRKNLWAIRWIYLHLLHGGLCVRPPYSMVEHLGFDDRATTSAGAWLWQNPPLGGCPLIPRNWPEPIEHASCSALWSATVRA